MNRELNSDNLKGFDRAFREVATLLASKLTWLNESYGLSKTLVTNKGTIPVVYSGAGDYEALLPSETHGAFSFFTLEDPVAYEPIPNQSGWFKGKASFIVWLNIKQAYSADEYFNTEAVKLQVLKALSATHTQKFRFSVSKIYESVDGVYKGFTHNNTNTKFLMYPYCGFRFEGGVTLIEPC